MLPCIHDGNQTKCTFDLKGKFTTNLELALARNIVHALQPPRLLPEKESWTKQPPDFSYRLYITPSFFKKPIGKPKELKKKTKSSSVHEELSRIRSRLFVQVMEPEKQPTIITRFPHVGPYEAQLMFVKMGKFKSSKYQDPKPYDYRQYEKDIPNFVTSIAKDPLNLKFRSQCLSKVHGLQPLKDAKMGSRSMEKFITYKAKELKWDSKLFLPKDPWPTKSGSFTRHRIQRGAHSAFIERVDEVLSKLWLEEAREKKARRSRKKAADSIHQERLSATVSTEKYLDMELWANRAKGLQKGWLSQSPSVGPHVQGMPLA
ncbi:hypothetical protein JRQ81_018649 [Phrynocephalus forsythii]|uniref:Uncharacterized protein n=1 Tax=Phrynocephalus forsythii TaxID=171643 RepID=A0A9Q0XRE1_9SAUR|nr:hypothetical protein JRQ81_018649 [Phrynocephalus forsythii]